MAFDRYTDTMNISKDTVNRLSTSDKTGFMQFCILVCALSCCFVVFSSTLATLSHLVINPYRKV
jgi:hypothetical protein